MYCSTNSLTLFRAESERRCRSMPYCMWLNVSKCAAGGSRNRRLNDPHANERTGKAWSCLHCSVLSLQFIGSKVSPDFEDLCPIIVKSFRSVRVFFLLFPCIYCPKLFWVLCRGFVANLKQFWQFFQTKTGHGFLELFHHPWSYLGGSKVNYRKAFKYSEVRSKAVGSYCRWVLDLIMRMGILRICMGVMEQWCPECPWDFWQDK